MANMSWVITLSRDGDDGDGEQSILMLKAEPHLWSKSCHAGRYLNVFTEFTTSPASSSQDGKHC